MAVLASTKKHFWPEKTFRSYFTVRLFWKSSKKYEVLKKL